MGVLTVKDGCGHVVMLFSPARVIRQSQENLCEEIRWRGTRIRFANFLDPGNPERFLRNVEASVIPSVQKRTESPGSQDDGTHFVLDIFEEAGR